MYFCYVKRKLRTYLSVALVFSLVLQSGLYGFIHIQDNHSHDKAHHEEHHACDHAVDVDHQTSSDFEFNTSEDCDGCDLLLALDEQSTVSGTAVDYAFHTTNYPIHEALKSDFEDNSVIFIQGRAPPRA